MFNRKGEAASVEELEDDAARYKKTCQSSFQTHWRPSHHRLQFPGHPIAVVLSYLCSVNRAIPNSSDRAR